jgi:myo-inositol catabolism protein IolC
MVKHASMSTNVTQSASVSELEGDDSLVRTTAVPIPKGVASGKTKFYDQALQLFSKVVDNSAGMLQSFQNANALLERVDNHMETLINKL